MIKKKNKRKTKQNKRKTKQNKRKTKQNNENNIQKGGSQLPLQASEFNNKIKTSLLEFTEPLFRLNETPEILEYKLFINLVVKNTIKKVNTNNTIKNNALLTYEDFKKISFQNEEVYNYILNQNIIASKLNYQKIKNIDVFNTKTLVNTKLLLLDLHGSINKSIFKLPNNINIVFISSIKYMTCSIQPFSEKDYLSENPEELNNFFKNPSCYNKDNYGSIFQQSVIYYGGQYCIDLNLSRSAIDHVKGLLIYKNDIRKFMQVNQDILPSFNKGDYKNTLNNLINDIMIKLPFYNGDKTITIFITSCRDFLKNDYMNKNYNEYNNGYNNMKRKKNNNISQFIFYEKLIKAINFKTLYYNMFKKNPTLENFIECYKLKKFTNNVTHVETFVNNVGLSIKSNNISKIDKHFKISGQTIENIKNEILHLKNIEKFNILIVKYNIGQFMRFDIILSIVVFERIYNDKNNVLLYIFNNDYKITLQFLIHLNYILNIGFIKHLTNFININLKNNKINEFDLQNYGFNDLIFISEELKNDGILYDKIIFLNLKNYANNSINLYNDIRTNKNLYKFVKILDISNSKYLESLYDILKYLPNLLILKITETNVKFTYIPNHIYIIKNEDAYLWQTNSNSNSNNEN